MRRAGEAGFALPTVLFVMLGAFAIGSVAAIASIGAQKGTARDHNTKTAIASAEAGVSQALLRYNRVRLGGATSPCLVVEGSTMVQQDPVDDWCEDVPGQLADGSQFAYWVSPAEDQILIVSQGTADEVTRRVEVSAISRPQQPFADATLVGLQHVNLASNAQAEADVATNGNVVLGAGAKLCGVAQVGLGGGQVIGDGSHTAPPSCETGGPVLQDEVSLPPVNQGDVADNNSNGRFFEMDPISGKKENVIWDPETRELEIKQNSALTLGGSNYSFCKLTMSSNTTLYIAAGATVNIFFDAPEDCGYEDGETQLTLNQNSSIRPNGAGPTRVALLFVGSESLSTKILLRSNTHADAICGQNFVIYAPRTEITMASNSHYCGAIAGKSIDMASNAQVRASNLAQEFELPNSESPYTPERFVECSGPASSPPNNGC